MNLDNDYDNDGNNIVPCPICLDVYCPSKDDIEHSTGANSTRLLKDSTPDTKKCNCTTWKNKRGFSMSHELNCPRYTPDTEWEKEFDEIWEARPAPEQRTHLKEAIKEFISSHTTHWKERVRKEVEGMRRNEAHPPIPEIRGDSWRMGYNQALDTLLDNLK